MIMRLAILLCVVLAAASAMKLTRFADCGSKGGKINSIDVEGCSGEPCNVHKGNTYHVRVNFTASAPANEANNVLHGIISGLSLPFPVSPANECSNDIQCPINSGETKEYTVSLSCPSFAPSIKLASKWQLQDENRRDILCFVVPLEIVS